MKILHHSLLINSLFNFYQVEVERTELEPEPSPSSSPTKQVKSETPPSPISPDIKPLKTADKMRKGLPAFIWVIGK